jgi:hypothetical protein
MPDGTFALPGMEKGYIPRSDVKRVRPLAPRKFKARWGSMAPRLRRLGVLEETTTASSSAEFVRGKEERWQRQESCGREKCDL